jgi:CBS domain-containing protein
MNICRHILNAPAVLILLSRPASAAAAEAPAPILEWSFYTLLIFAGCVIAFVFLKTSKKRKHAPLSSMLDETTRPVNFVNPDTTVIDSVRLMNEQNIGAVLVMDNDKLEGIFTERDALTKVLAEGVDPVNTKISEVMTTEPIFVDPSTTVEEAIGIVNERRIRHLPVLHNGKLVGIVSSGDLTHWLVRDREGEIRELVDMAADTRPR